MPILRRKSILSAGLILKKEQLAENVAFKRRNMQGRRQEKPNHDRVRVFDKYCNGDKLVK